MRAALSILLAWCLLATPALAQQQNAAQNLVTYFAEVQEQLAQGHMRLARGVEIINGDTRLFADQAEYFENEGRVVASGNVVVSQGQNTIAADRADFNINTRLGTFYNASGSASIRPRPQSSPGGFTPPPLSDEETDVYFFGETVEKIGAKKYRISSGGFTTCVQPTPRWNLNAGTMVLNVGDYTLLRNAVFRVKDVPLLYLPILYYPTKEEERATGFLLPTYSSSTLRGQSISIPFFWAISRSQDATVAFDWFSKTGRGFDTEYRFTRGGGSDGTIRAYVLDDREITVAGPGGPTALPARRSFDLRGNANHLLPGNLRASATVDYQSQAMRSLYTNVYDATKNQRNFGGNIAGAWGATSLNASIQRNETFYGDGSSSVISGNMPRVAFSRSQRPLFRNAPVYFSLQAEGAHLERESRVSTGTTDTSVGRIDVQPQINYPFKRWQWFTVNSTLTWRDTYYTRSVSPGLQGQGDQIVDEGLNRSYFVMSANAIGPIFNRIWDTPGSGYAERLKHSIEPFLNVSRTTAIEDADRIVQSVTDYVVGNTSAFQYGVRNRFYAKRRVGQTSQPREIASVEIQQSYHTSARSARVDPNYVSSNPNAEPTKFTPVAISANAAPTDALSTTLRAEIDSRHKELRTLSVNSSYNWTGVARTSANWTRYFFIEGLEGFDEPDRLSHYLNVNTNVSTRDNRVGGLYSISYDFRAAVRHQSIQAFYNAQCCGIAFQFQTSGFGLGGVPISNNRQFFISFSLAGLGNFSPFSGGLGGVPR